jgi:hypothetical protein
MEFGQGVSYTTLLGAGSGPPASTGETKKQPLTDKEPV